MPRAKSSPVETLLSAPRVREAARALIQAVAAEVEERALPPGRFEGALKEIERKRGQPLPFPTLRGGGGHGARVRLADGTIRLDFLGGLGVHAFGHGDPDLLETAVTAAAADTVLQGHLDPGPEYLRLSRALLRHAGRRLKHVWLSPSDAMANENALKIVLQKHHPADRIVAFEGGFAGRTLALAELSDAPGGREGLPLRGAVDLVPFWNAVDADSTQRSVEALDAILARHPGRVAGMLFELVQAESGFDTAPPGFFHALMERCREAGLAVWVDEARTFARTGELFAFQQLGLAPHVDLVTCAGALQGGAVLFAGRYKPRPGLVGGTWAGSTVGMAVGARIIERLEEEGFLGPEGRIALLARRFERRLDALSRRCPRAIGPSSGVGAMQAFVVFDGSLEITMEVLRAAHEEGLMAFVAGRDPAKIRMLLPLNTRDEELETGLTMLEKALRRVAEQRELPC